MIWHFSVSRVWDFLEKRYMQPISIWLICWIASKQSWQTMYSWKSPVDGRARRSLSRNEDAAATQISATNDGRRRGSRETQNHGRRWVKHHPGHSFDLSFEVCSGASLGGDQSWWIDCTCQLAVRLADHCDSFWSRCVVDRRVSPQAWGAERRARCCCLQRHQRCVHPCSWSGWCRSHSCRCRRLTVFEWRRVHQHSR